MLIIIYFTDEDDVYNNPNFHSEEQDELEIPNGKYFQIYNKHFFQKNPILLIYTFLLDGF